MVQEEMKIVEITASVGQTVQIKQYEPRTYHVSVKVEVGEEKVEDAFKLAREKANEEVADYFYSLSNKIEINKSLKKATYKGEKRPDLLSLPNLPKPLHGIAPRTIKGQAWWNKIREEAYQSTDYHCLACGVSKEEAKGHKWLEAHEVWETDYKKGITKVIDIVPLCHYCHNFIHSGRLSKILGQEKSEKEVKEILEHGFKILSHNKLQCFPGTLELAENIGAKTYKVTAYEHPKTKVKWENWKLIFEGKEYKSQFKDINEWEIFYEDKNNKAMSGKGVK